MNIKVFAALFVTVLCAKATLQTSLKDDSFKDIVVVVLNKVLAATGNLITKFNDDLDSIMINRDKLTKDLQDFIAEKAEQVSQNIYGLIDDLANNATDNGKIVISCIEAEQNNTDMVIEAMAYNASYCITSQIGIFMLRIKEVALQLDLLQFRIEDQVDTLSSCSDDELSCLTAFVQILEETIQNALDVFKSDIENIIHTIKIIENNFRLCRVRLELQEMFNETVACIMA